MLLVDDHADVRALMRVLLEQAGLVVAAEAGTGEEALAAAAGVDVAVVDAKLAGGMDGFELAVRLRAVHAGLPVVLCSGVVDEETERRAAHAGISACVAKGDVASLAGVVAQTARKNSTSGSASGRATSSR